MATVALPPIPTGPDRPRILARTYPGDHERAVELFQMDAEALADHGYLPVAQSYSEGRYSGGTIAAATILVVVGIGIVMLIYMAAARPPGVLAATFVLGGAPR